ncbi:hypothetical protein V8B97DRAFT_2003813 [Scleroderma yunnanense]
MSSSQLALAERLLPTRGAAQRASASFVGQLMDSPTRSDDGGDHSDNDPGPYSFGEPSARKSKSVKYRYSAAGKHRSSPLKGSSASPERKGKAAVKPKSKPRPKAPRTPSIPLSSSQPTASTTKGRRSVKRKASLSPPHREPSELSPLSSAPPSPSIPWKLLSPLSPASTQTTQPASPTVKTAPLRPEIASCSKASLSQPLSTAKKKTDELVCKTGQDTWTIGTPVWVSVDRSGAVHDEPIQLANDADADPQSSEHMWWPAQIMAKEPIRVSLFGDFPSDSSTLRRTCTIAKPSPGNILSINDECGTRRFDRSIFRIRSTADDLVDLTSPPPQKKQRLDNETSLDDRWEEAVSSMEKASALEREGLPAVISSYANGNGSFSDSLDDPDPDTSTLRKSAAVPPTTSKTKTLSRTRSTGKLKSQHSKASLKVTYAPTPRSRSVCPPDPTIQIPGELVLAQAPGTGSYYWPGKILSHRPDTYEKYMVQFLDDKVYCVSRGKFWTSEEKGFVTCLLGEWESAVKTTDDPESEDEGEVNGNAGQDDLDNVPREPPPPPGEFDALSVHAQLAYVKPVLRAILEKRYAPALMKHEAFMKGGSARAALLKTAGVRGGLDARFIKVVQRAICKWMIGDSDRPVRYVLDTNGDTIISGSTADAVNPPMPPEAVNKEPSEDVKMDGIEEIVPSGDGQPEGAEGNPRTPTSKEGGSKEEAPENLDSHTVLDQPEQPLVVSLADGSRLPSPLTEVTESPESNDQSDPSNNSHISKPELATPAPDEIAIEPDASTSSDDTRQELPRPIGCDEFETLPGVEKLDYCLNVLLPEAVQQLLLWRSGERVNVTLLSDAEEQRLHDIAVKKASETDWVDDVMRLREAQARLWGVDLNKAAQEEKKIVPGGTRTRPRMATIPK